MSGSDRGQRDKNLGATIFGSLAIAGVIALTYSLAFLNGREAERRQQSPAAYSQAAQQDAQRACVGREGRALFECVYERAKASQEQARGEQDLSAQQRAASSALAGAVIAFLTLLVSLLGVWFVKRTLEATLEAVDDTGKATTAMLRQNELTELSQKPWLRPTVGVRTTPAREQIVALANSGDKVSFNADMIYQVSISNHGKLPALIRYYQCFIFGQIIGNGIGGGIVLQPGETKRLDEPDGITGTTRINLGPEGGLFDTELPILECEMIYEDPLGNIGKLAFAYRPGAFIDPSPRVYGGNDKNYTRQITREEADSYPDIF